MAYDPADLRLPHWLLWSFDLLVRISLPIFPGWRLQLTRPGILFLVALLAVIAAALYSGNNLLYLCAAMLFVLAASAAGHALWLLKSMPLLAEYMPKYTTAQQHFAMRTTLVWGFPVSGNVKINWDMLSTYKQQDMPTCSLRAEGDNKSLLTARFPAYARGIYNCQRQWLSTDAPLGLWHFSCVRDEKWIWLVLPAPIVWTQAGQVITTTSNSVVRISAPEGDEWYDLRSYTPGDPLARIHWRKGVHREQWVVKRFGQAQSQTKSNTLCVDLRIKQGKDGMEKAFERLLGMAYAWIRDNPQGMIIIGQQNFNLSDPEQQQQAWYALAAATPEDKAPMLEENALLLSLITPA